MYGIPAIALGRGDARRAEDRSAAEGRTNREPLTIATRRTPKADRGNRPHTDKKFIE